MAKSSTSLLLGLGSSSYGDGSSSSSGGDHTTTCLESDSGGVSLYSYSGSFRILTAKIRQTMKRISLRTCFLVFLFVFIVATVSSVVDQQNRFNFTIFKAVYHSSSPDRPGGGSDDNNSNRNTVSVPLMAKQQIPDEINYEKYPWTYNCIDNKCQRVLADSKRPKVSLDVCWLTCGPVGPLWPAPAQVTLSRTTAAFHPHNFLIRDVSGPSDLVKSLLQIASNITRHEIKRITEGKYQNKRRHYASPTADSSDIPRYHSPDSTIVEVHLLARESVKSLTDTTDESYELSISSVTMGTGALVNVNINGSTYFGVRHGLETLYQLIAYDEINHCLQIVDDVKIFDGPAFPIRGIMIDTARNYIPMQNIYRTVDALSQNKMNTLHWHITDSNSFPFQSKLVPQMSEYGAYSPSKIYTMEDIKNLVYYAQLKGVRIVPELDAPAHAGNGWQWGNIEGYGELALCIGKEPWHSYCGQPPCGQLNVMNSNVFEILERIYEDMLEAFDPIDIFHMGGDEVMPQCWNELAGIDRWSREHRLTSHIEIWGYFQKKSFQKLRDAHKKKPISAVVWSSGLTGSKQGQKFLNPDNFIVQIWESGSSSQIRDLLRSGYRLIFSNVDSMYLDFGDGSWLGSEHDYKFYNWQVFYDNDLDRIVSRAIPDTAQAEKASRLVLGGIATLWSEKVDENNIDAKLWPRSSAVAERLWSNPKESSRDIVHARLNYHANRLKIRGIHAATLQPESCLQMSGNCADKQHPL